MHLAAAVGTPTVTIVQTASAPYYRPIGDVHAQVRADDGAVDAVIALVKARLPRPAVQAYG
jgi:ADP-heptose:LPS heptosyltransferase